MAHQDYVPVLFFFYNQFSSTGIIFIIFCSKWIFFTGNIFSRTFHDIVNFKDISRTWKMNLLFSRMHGNPVLSTEGGFDYYVLIIFPLTTEITIP